MSFGPRNKAPTVPARQSGGNGQQRLSSSSSVVSSASTQARNIHNPHSGIGISTTTAKQHQQGYPLPYSDDLTTAMASVASNAIPILNGFTNTALRRSKEQPIPAPGMTHSSSSGTHMPGVNVGVVGNAGDMYPYSEMDQEELQLMRSIHTVYDYYARASHVGTQGYRTTNK
jgi:hypothetical protein